MALVLTQPNHVMYLPVSHHLLAKASLDFSTVPELYTFLHSSDINYKEHRIFILELLRDGLRTEKDLTDFMRSMAFKLFSELYSSSVSDMETNLLILDVLKAVCKIPVGTKMLIENQSLLAQLYSSVNNILQSFDKDKYNPAFIDSIISIILIILQTAIDQNSNFLAFFILKSICCHQSFDVIVKDSTRQLYECFYMIICRYPQLFTEEFILSLLCKTNDSFSEYLLTFGPKFVELVPPEITNHKYFLRLLVQKFKIVNVKEST